MRHTLRSGNIEYCLAQKPDGVFVDHFGPVGTPNWIELSASKLEVLRFQDFNGRAHRHDLSPFHFDLKSDHRETVAPDIDQLTLVLAHKHLPLEVRLVYRAHGDTGVFSRQTHLRNTGTAELHIEKFPSFNLRLPCSDYDLATLNGCWEAERQFHTERLPVIGRRSFIQTSGRSTNGFASWFCLHDVRNDVRYMAQLACSGNWEMNFTTEPNQWVSPHPSLEVDMGLRCDLGQPLVLAPGATFTLPAVAFTAGREDLDQLANRMHRYQRRYVVPRTPSNDPLLVQFNSWYPFPGKMHVDDMKACADVAAQIGAEIFVLDAGWYNQKNWGRELGDYIPDPKAFPHGLEELANYVRSRGLKFGLWVEIECLGIDSAMFKNHPDWLLTYQGKPVIRGARAHLDLAKPEVAAWAFATLSDLITRLGLVWVKNDYNINVGEYFDFNGQNTALHSHLQALYALFDKLRAAFPQLIIENCASGGLRMDLGTIAHTHTTWFSDNTLPRCAPQLAWGSTLEFLPEICNHWMTGDTPEQSVAQPVNPDWCDYLFRVAMNGQFGISSLVQKWTPEVTASATRNVALYKRIRSTIAGADVYHLTPCPRHLDPTGWLALEYYHPQHDRTLLMAYRLREGSPRQVFQLRSIDPARTYTLFKNGTEVGTITGTQLSDNGFAVELPRDYSAAVIELTPTAP